MTHDELIKRASKVRASEWYRPNGWTDCEWKKFTNKIDRTIKNIDRKHGNNNAHKIL